MSGSGAQKFVYRKWPDHIFPVVNFVFSHCGHCGLEGGGPRGPLLLWCMAILNSPPHTSVVLGMVAPLAPPSITSLGGGLLHPIRGLRWAGVRHTPAVALRLQGGPDCAVAEQPPPTATAVSRLQRPGEYDATDPYDPVGRQVWMLRRAPVPRDPSGWRTGNTGTLWERWNSVENAVPSGLEGKAMSPQTVCCPNKVQYPAAAHNKADDVQAARAPPQLQDDSRFFLFFCFFPLAD